MRSFLRCHRDISLHTPQAVSIARAVGLDQPQVDKFFELLGNIIQECNISPEQICNIDESSVTVEQIVGKMLAKKSKHQVGAITSQENSNTVDAQPIISCAIVVEYVILLPKRVHK